MTAPEGHVNAEGGPGYYNAAGAGYAGRRRADRRIEAQIWRALDSAATVLNVGAGPGSYEPSDRLVVAVEPSLTMLRQRSNGNLCLRGAAEALPFADGAFEAGMAILTIHHWSDWRRGLSELARVARRAVVLTVDTEALPRFWLMDYFPQILERDRKRMPPLGEVGALVGGTPEPVPVPHDCSDGFLGAFWRYPEHYLDADARAGMSAFAMVSAEELETGLARLREDIESRQWKARYGRLLEADALDLGYRLVYPRPAG